MQIRELHFYLLMPLYHLHFRHFYFYHFSGIFGHFGISGIFDIYDFFGISACSVTAEVSEEIKDAGIVEDSEDARIISNSNILDNEKGYIGATRDSEQQIFGPVAHFIFINC